MIEKDHPRLSLRRQFKLLGMSRSTLNYKPAPRNEGDIKTMKFLKETYMKDPTFGSRRAVKLIERATANENHTPPLKDQHISQLSNSWEVPIHGE